MDWRDYMDNVREDAKNAIDDNIAYYDSFQSLYDDLFNDDSVTGNGSGSYYFNSYKAAEAVSGIIFDEEAQNELRRTVAIICLSRTEQKVWTLSRVAFAWGCFLVSLSNITTSSKTRTSSQIIRG